VVADESARGERLDLFLTRTLAGVSRKAIKQALDAGRVFVGGTVERRAGQVLQGGETVTLTLALPAPAPEVPLLPVLFRDEELLAVAKPAGLPAHPTVAGRVNALELVRGALPDVRAPFPILLHRLDLDTTGVLLFALTAAANRSLAAQFAARQVTKIYLALIAGNSPESLQIADFLKAGVRGRSVRVASGGQPAETVVRTLARGPGFALVEARPRTGRTHQIRAHLAEEGYPLLGDNRYGGPASIQLPDGQVLTATRQLLHAYRLSFIHPRSNEPVTVEAPVPPEFKPFLENLEKPFEI
jgi:23S rRNA pseudouridine1911/1915/1917 synthase